MFKLLVGFIDVIYVGVSEGNSVGFDVRKSVGKLVGIKEGILDIMQKQTRTKIC